MTTTAGVLFLIPVLLLLAAYVGYPLLLWLLPKRPSQPKEPTPYLPELTIVVPVYNEANAIRETLDTLLACDYPADHRHVLVISDASSDGTDDIVSTYVDRGVSLVRLTGRRGKTAAENEAAKYIRGEVIVNMDATIRIPRDALRCLVAAFADPTVGVASGRDVSVGDEKREQNRHESTYVGYEMWIRRLETRAGGIVGASGCFYAIRRHLFDSIFPNALSRDFASPLIAREAGYRSVSVDDAICFVPRTRSLRAEYRRKVRTMTRGLETLWYKRHMLNPRRYGLFALFLLGHKLIRWLVFLGLPLGAVGLLMLALRFPWARGLLLLAGVGLALGALGYYWPEARRPPRLVAIAGFGVSSNVAGVEAWIRALSGELNPVWEPTRRP